MSAVVTIVTATRNRPAMLERALASIARQTFPNYEAFVVDDGSEAEHAASYRAVVGGFDKRFHLLQPLHPGQSGSGPSASRNRGIAAGRGRYLAFLDDDDTWTWDDHLKVAVEMLDQTGVELYCADMQGFRGESLILETWFEDRRPLVSSARARTDPPIYRVTRAAFVEAARHRSVHPNMIVVSRQLVDRVGKFLERLSFSEDVELILRLVDGTDTVLFCDKPVARYRLPQGDSISLSMNGIEQDLQTLAAAQHVRMVARSPEVRRQAGNLESWTLRLLSRALKRDGRRGAALGMALQGLVAQPTLGGVLHLVRTIAPEVGPWRRST
jgi:glycosyltransferase involved in cell wall biosynthesis